MQNAESPIRDSQSFCILHSAFCILHSAYTSPVICLYVKTTPGFWLLASTLWLLDPWGLVPAWLLAAAVHEAGHLAALRWLGIPVRGLELRATGAVIRAELRGAAREGWALAAGPAVNLLLAAALPVPLWPRLRLCSLALGLWNLLPFPPLDGGRILALFFRDTTR